jgi:mono/diheme cytochrome c family protein
MAMVGGPIVEAEKYDSNSPIAPFVIEALPGGVEYIIVPGTGGTMAAADNGPGQAWYTFKATAPQITIYATANLATDVTDSFHYQIAGLSAWAAQNMLQTVGFQEVMLATVNGAVVGQTYVFKIQRREAGARLDKFRLVGGLFTEGSGMSDPVDPDPVDPNPTPVFDLLNGKTQYDTLCTGCHGNRGQGGTAKAIPNTRTQEALANFVSDNMPPSNPRLCEGKCGVDVAAYIRNNFSTIPPVVSTIPAGCTGASTVDANDLVIFQGAPLAAPVNNTISLPQDWKVDDVWDGGVIATLMVGTDSAFSFGNTGIYHGFKFSSPTVNGARRNFTINGVDVYVGLNRPNPNAALPNFGMRIIKPGEFEGAGGAPTTTWMENKAAGNSRNFTIQNNCTLISLSTPQGFLNANSVGNRFIWEMTGNWAPADKLVVRKVVLKGFKYAP